MQWRDYLHLSGMRLRVNIVSLLKRKLFLQGDCQWHAFSLDTNLMTRKVFIAPYTPKC